VLGQDDYACMREVLSRRIEHGINDKNSDGEKNDFYPFPDLILVDGGHAHVNTALKVLSEFGINIPVFGIAKDDKH
ncbi:MAG: excinuclease ABC subunit C, partial [Clostridia bacterium]|nr:excinuclease ABC subunit C [Clostridia bacterium]